LNFFKYLSGPECEIGKSCFAQQSFEVLSLAKIGKLVTLLVVFGLIFVALSARRGIGIDVHTDGNLFARGMLDEVNVTLTNRDNHQHKIVAELVAVTPGSLVPTEPLGESASAPATLNSGDRRLLNMALDTSNLQPGQRYKIGILVYANGNSTASPLKGSLLAISYVSTITICDPLEVVNANLSLCNEIGILGVSSDLTTT